MAENHRHKLLKSSKKHNTIARATNAVMHIHVHTFPAFSYLSQLPANPPPSHPSFSVLPSSSSDGNTCDAEREVCIPLANEVQRHGQWARLGLTAPPNLDWKTIVPKMADTL